MVNGKKQRNASHQPHAVRGADFGITNFFWLKSVPVIIHLTVSHKTAAVGIVRSATSRQRSRASIADARSRADRAGPSTGIKSNSIWVAISLTSCAARYHITAAATVAKVDAAIKALRKILIAIPAYRRVRVRALCNALANYTVSTRPVVRTRISRETLIIAIYKVLFCGILPSLMPKHLLGISERALTLVDEILVRSMELKLLQQALKEEFNSPSPRRGLTLIAGGAHADPNAHGGTDEVREELVLGQN